MWRWGAIIQIKEKEQLKVNAFKSFTEKVQGRGEDISGENLGGGGHTGVHSSRGRRGAPTWMLCELVGCG